MFTLCSHLRVEFGRCSPLCSHLRDEFGESSPLCSRLRFEFHQCSSLCSHLWVAFHNSSPLCSHLATTCLPCLPAAAVLVLPSAFLLHRSAFLWASASLGVLFCLALTGCKTTNLSAAICLALSLSLCNFYWAWLSSAHGALRPTNNCMSLGTRATCSDVLISRETTIQTKANAAHSS